MKKSEIAEMDRLRAAVDRLQKENQDLLKRNVELEAVNVIVKSKHDALADIILEAMKCGKPFTST